MSLRLYLTDAEGVSRMHALKALREALRVIDPEAKVHQADALLAALAERGHAHMATGDPITLSLMSDVLTEAGLVAHAVPESEVERAERRWESKRAQRGGATPEQEPPRSQTFSPAAYETALACLAICNGDPMKAALHAHALARTTKDAVIYHETMHVYGVVFPWTVNPLREHGVWPE